MSWIEYISYEAATGRLKKLYDRVRGPDGNVDNILLMHSLRPQTLEGHMSLYKNVLHHSGNTVPKWFLEALGVYVSQLNGCEYCVSHHVEGMARLIDDRSRTEQVYAALMNSKFENVFTEKEQAALEYARELTLNPAGIEEALVISMREQGFEEGEILEVNQVCAYFSYANRTVLGLGTSTEGDTLGLSPGNAVNPDDWSHQ